MSEEPMVESAPHTRKESSGIVWGMILILLGGLFLLQQLTNFSFENWWALFILIPAIGSFTGAYASYRRHNRFSEGVRSGLSTGIIILAVALMFLLNLDWSKYWPVMLIVGAFSFFLNGFTLPGSRESGRPLALRLYRPWTGWLGLAGMALGAAFLVRNMGIFDPSRLANQWWAAAILIPAFGGLVTALRLITSGHGFGWATISNLITTAIFTVVGLVALTNLDWNLLTPIVIIAAGVIVLLGVFRK